MPDVPVEEDAGVGELASTLEVGITREGVRLTFHTTNTAPEPMEFTFPTSQRYDFLVETADGEPVWQWSADRAFLQALSHETLEPGETWTVSEEWEPGSASGPHVAVARLTAMDRPVERRAAFDLP